MIILHLTHTPNNETFYVSTFHMPCKYRHEYIMKLYASTYIKQVQLLSEKKDIPYVITGDFNIDSTLDIYKFLIDGQIDDHKTHHYPIRSVYYVKNGYEPDYTIKVIKEDKSSYCGTLDYIFISKHFKVDDVKPLDNSIKGVLPNDKYGSDHLPIGAKLKLSR